MKETIVVANDAVHPHGDDLTRLLENGRAEGAAGHDPAARRGAAPGAAVAIGVGGKFPNWTGSSMRDLAIGAATSPPKPMTPLTVTANATCGLSAGAKPTGPMLVY